MSQVAKQQQYALERVRDLWAGNEKFHERSSVYLPQAPGEESDDYRVRLERAVLHEFFNRTVDGLVGLVFRRDPVLGDDVPAAIRGESGHWENIDNCGTHGAVFAREIAQDAMIAGHAAIFVEYPATGGAQTRADETFGTIRPYWIPIQKENILSWRTTVEHGRTVLTQVVLKEIAMVPDGDFGEKEQVRYRVLYRENGVVGYRLLAITENKVVVTVAEGTYPTQAEIPLAEVVTSGKTGLFASRPPLSGVADLCIAHYRQWSDYDTSIHKTCVPIFVMIGVDPSNDDRPSKVVIGPNSYVSIPDPAGDAKYASHDGASLGSCRQALEDLKSDIGSLGLAMLAPQKRAAETAEAKRLDKASSDSALSVTARGLQDGLERALGFHARYLNEKDGGSVEVNRDFEGLLMDPAVMSAFAALVREGMPMHLALAELQKGGRIAEDVDIEEIALEMAANQIAQEQRERDEAEARAAEVGQAA